jgi:soluble lytic murein transglycosylase
MRNVLIVFLFLQLSSLSYAAQSPAKLSKAKSFNHYDIKIAQILRQLIHDPKSQLSYKVARRLKQEISQSTVFFEQKSLFHTIVKISGFSSPISTYNQCHKLETSSNPLAKSLVKWCEQKVISRFLKVNSKRKREYYANRFFEKVPKSIFAHKRFIRSLFSQLQKRKELHKTLSSHYLSLLIANQKMLPKSFASVIYIAPRFEDFLKIKDQTTTKPTSHFLYSQLYKIRKQYYRASKQLDFVKLKELSKQALSLIQDNYDEFRRYDIKTLLFIGQGFQKLNYVKEAQKYYRSLYLLGKSKERESNPFVFYYLWSFVKEEDYAGALKAIYQHDIIDQLETYSRRVQFWIAYIFQKNSEYKIAHYIYSRIIDESPLSYYATMADGQLEYNKNLFAKKIIRLTKRQPLKKPHQLDKKLITKIREVNLWHYIGYSQYAQNMISSILSGETYPLGKKSKEIKEAKYLILSEILSFLKAEKLYLPLFQTVFQNMDSIDPKSLKSVIKYLFPFEYYTKISEFTQSANPIVILSLIRQESGFNPKAKSLPGARGLMQIMPETAEDLDIFNVKNLYDPKKNIKAGIKYFEYLLDTFDKNLVFALASYNAGPHRVKKWKNSIFKTNNPLIMIENIPYKETRKYVKLIYRNVYFYNLLHRI